MSTALKLYENQVILDKKAEAGTGEGLFYLVSGSRLLVTLRVLSLDPGASVVVTVLNSETASGPFDTLTTLTLLAAGVVKDVVSDFNANFKLAYTVSGGSATFRASVAVSETSYSDIHHSTNDIGITVQENKLITTPHDTAQVTAYTPAGDPLTIVIRKGGLTGPIMQTLNLTYDASGNFLSVVRTPYEP